MALRSERAPQESRSYVGPCTSTCVPPGHRPLPPCVTCDVGRPPRPVYKAFMGPGQDEDTRDAYQTGSHHCISKRFSSMIDAHCGDNDLLLFEEHVYAPPGAFH